MIIDTNIYSRHLETDPVTNPRAPSKPVPLRPREPAPITSNERCGVCGRLGLEWRAEIGYQCQDCGTVQG